LDFFYRGSRLKHRKSRSRAWLPRAHSATAPSRSRCSSTRRNPTTTASFDSFGFPNSFPGHDDAEPGLLLDQLHLLTDGMCEHQETKEWPSCQLGSQSSPPQGNIVSQRYWAAASRATDVPLLISTCVWVRVLGVSSGIVLHPGQTRVIAVVKLTTLLRSF
jgi:hypothetical protein